jgi:nucleotide-binding universal stress UspA family protein
VPLSRISVGLDGSNAASDALRWASGLADATGVPLRAIGTWQMPYLAAIPVAVGSLPSQAFMASHCAENLDHAIGEVGLSGDVEIVTREGEAGEVLVAETGPGELLVVGRTGRGRRHGLARMAEVLLGSTARYCVHNASGPVAAIPTGSAWAGNANVVVGVDGSPSSRAALAWAVDSLPASCPIHAVRTIAPYIDGLAAIDPGVLDRVLESAERELRGTIDDVVTPLGPEAIARVVPHVVVATARDGLSNPGFPVDLIVVGQRGNTGVKARFLGSVSDHTVRHAPCPVVVVPPNEPS